MVLMFPWAAGGDLGETPAWPYTTMCVDLRLTPLSSPWTVSVHLLSGNRLYTLIGLGAQIA